MDILIVKIISEKLLKVILSSFLSTTHPKYISPKSHKLSVFGPMVKYIQTPQQGLKWEAPTEEVTDAMELSRVCVVYLKDTFAVSSFLGKSIEVKKQISPEKTSRIIIISDTFLVFMASLDKKCKYILLKKLPKTSSKLRSASNILKNICNFN